MENTINYRTNMQDIFHQLADMKLTKKDRKAIAEFIRAAYINGTAANEAGDADHREDIIFLANEASK